MRIAVTGASGRIGSQVVRLVAAEQRHQVVALSRRGLLPGRWPPSVSARAADYTDPQALSAALRDVDTLVFVSSDGPVAEVMVHHQNVIRAADGFGVAHIVALSGLDADLSSPFCYAVSYGYTERLLAESRCAVSIARASIYTEFFAGFLARARASGRLPGFPATAGSRSSRAATSRGAWPRWPWRLRAADGTTSPDPSPSTWMPSQPRAPRVGHPAQVRQHRTRRALRGDGSRRGGSMVDVCLLDDVRVDPGTALGGDLRRDPWPDRTLANASPHRARPLQRGLMERHHAPWSGMAGAARLRV